MALFFAMLPVYLFGNLHCLGMCGPLVLMLGQHRHRNFYFLGRTLSFTLGGGLAGAIGAVADAFFKQYHLAEATSFLFGGLLIFLGIFTFKGGGVVPGQAWLSKQLAKINRSLSSLMLYDRAWSTFLFGFLTLALPCGQTLLVFSACALSGDLWVGLFNGFAFALLTSPSLFLAMQAHLFLARARGTYQAIIGASALLVGSLAILRGLAEMGVISHWILNPESPMHYHLVIF